MNSKWEDLVVRMFVNQQGKNDWNGMKKKHIRDEVERYSGERSVILDFI